MTRDRIEGKIIKTLGSPKGLCSCMHVFSVYYKGGTYVCGMISDKLTNPFFARLETKTPGLQREGGKGLGIERVSLLAALLLGQSTSGHVPTFALNSTDETHVD